MDNTNVPAAEPQLAITSIFGDARNRSTWSAAPASIADELERFGVQVSSIDTSVTKAAYATGGALHFLYGYGTLHYSEAIARGSFLRRLRAARLLAHLRQQRIRRVLHTGTLDFAPERSVDGLEHYLYCDSTWHLSLQYRPEAASYTQAAIEAFEKMERSAYESCTHIFTFGEYVRDDIINHYGIPADRVTAAGSGCGVIDPCQSRKDYTQAELLFVAKHLFNEKGGNLLLEAFRLARVFKPDLKLTVVGGAPGMQDSAIPGVTVLPFVDRDQLTAIQRRATLLVQPMFNDPWGQVYIEALFARTPVVGFNRNGLPEIVKGGEYGFLLDDESPEALACLILDALSDPMRLTRMGIEGQAYIQARYSWSRTAQSMKDTLWPAPVGAAPSTPLRNPDNALAPALPMAAEGRVGEVVG